MMCSKSFNATLRHGSKRLTQTQQRVNCIPMFTRSTVGNHQQIQLKDQPDVRPSKGSFKAIMSLFPLCYRMAKHDLEQDWSALTANLVEVLKPCRAIDFGDIKVWTDQIFGVGKPTPIENHLYHWMAWAVREYELTKELVKPELAWNTGDGVVDSAPGQGFFSPINPDYFTGTLKIENMTSTTELGGAKSPLLLIRFQMKASPKSSASLTLMPVVDDVQNPNSRKNSTGTDRSRFQLLVANLWNWPRHQRNPKILHRSHVR